MTALLRTLEGDQDRGRFFLGTYLRTTRAVAAALDDGAFEDAEWVAAGTSTSPGLYLYALEAYRVDPAGVAEPWRLAFGAKPGLPPEAHVLLGMNAHINFDLPQSLVRAHPAGGLRRPGPARAAPPRPRADRRRPGSPGRRGGRRPAARRRPPHPAGPRADAGQPHRQPAVPAGVAAQGVGQHRRAARGAVAAARPPTPPGWPSWRPPAPRGSRDLLRPGPVLLRLAVRGFGVTLPAS